MPDMPKIPPKPFVVPKGGPTPRPYRGNKAEAQMKKHVWLLALVVLIVVGGICSITISEPKCGPPKRMCGVGSGARCILQDQKCEGESSVFQFPAKPKTR